MTSNSSQSERDEKMDIDSTSNSEVKLKPGIGIDLGTTFSSIAKKSNRETKATLIETEDGLTYIPSKLLVAKDGTVQLLQEDMENDDGIIVYDIKRHIGRKYNEINEELSFAKYPYPIEIDDEGVKYLIHGTPYTPIELTSYIIGELKSCIESKWHNKTNKQQYPGRVVITVPSYFDAIQKKATLTAAHSVNVKDVTLLAEPSAALLHYIETAEQEIIDDFGIVEDTQTTNSSNKNKTKADSTIDTDPTVRIEALVVDIGGGTTDFSLNIVRGWVTDGQARWNIDNVNVNGLRFFGGQDISNAIKNRMLEYAREKHKEEVPDDQLDYISGKAELMKKKLTKKIGHAINVRFKNGKKCEFKLTQHELQYLMRDKMQKFNEKLQACTEDRKIDIVLIVGGSSSVPMIIEAVQTHVKNSKIVKIDNPRDAVAKGAAIASFYRSNRNINNKYVFNERNTFNIGIGVCRNNQKNIMYPIIQAGDGIPFCKEHKGFSNKYAVVKGEVVVAPIFEGEDPCTLNNTRIGSVKMIMDNNYAEDEFKMICRVSAQHTGGLEITCFAAHDRTLTGKFTWAYAGDLTGGEYATQQALEEREEKEQDKQKLYADLTQRMVYVEFLNKYEIECADIESKCTDEQITHQQFERMIIDKIKHKYQQYLKAQNCGVKPVKTSETDTAIIWMSRLEKVVGPKKGIKRSHGEIEDDDQLDQKVNPSKKKKSN